MLLIASQGNPDVQYLMANYSVSWMMVFSFYNKLCLYFRGPFDSTCILVYVDGCWMCEPFADYLQIMDHVPFQGLLNHQVVVQLIFDVIGILDIFAFPINTA